MVPSPPYRPKQLSLGPLETEILNIVWDLGTASVKDIHQCIVSQAARKLAVASVNTVLQRLANKGWLTCEKQGRQYIWRSSLSRQQAQVLQAYERLQQFLAVGSPDVVAAFADSLDQASLDKLDAIAQKLQAHRQSREQ